MANYSKMAIGEMLHEARVQERERIIALLCNPDNPFDWNLSEPALRDWFEKTWIKS